MANGNFGGGNGTALNPYLVEDAHDLDAVRNYLGNTSVHFKQVANIDLSSWGNWTPIQNETSTSNSSVFRGNYDGGGYKITNMTCHHNRNHVGLFGYTNGATIKNVFIENCNVNGNGSVGGLVGNANSSTISNCYSSGVVSGNEDVGGLVGRNYESNSTISNCYSSGSVSGDRYVGGLVGYSYSSQSTISNCYSNCNVSGRINVGGLAGYIFSGSSSFRTSNCYSSGNVSGSSDVGGLVGGGGNFKISNCYALNPFIARVASSTSTSFSDIVNGDATIENCYSLDTLEFRQL